MHVNIDNVVERIKLQLGAFEKTVSEARVRIDHVERVFNRRIKQVRRFVKLMEHSKEINMLTKIVDILNDIERIVDKLDSVDITLISPDEISLEGLMNEEFEKIERFVL